MLGEPGAERRLGRRRLRERICEGRRRSGRFPSLHFYPTALTDYDRRLHEVGAADGRPERAVPAGQAADGEVYRTFPATYIPPFSFVHPVTGKSLKDLPQPADDVAGRD